VGTAQGNHQTHGLAQKLARDLQIKLLPSPRVLGIWALPTVPGCAPPGSPNHALYNAVAKPSCSRVRTRSMGPILDICLVVHAACVTRTYMAHFTTGLIKNALPEARIGFAVSDQRV
jgi:hypothetical protein